VSTRNGGTEEFVIDGQTGRLVPPGDPAALARVVCELLNDSTERFRLGKAGAEEASTMTVSSSAIKLYGSPSTACGLL